MSFGIQGHRAGTALSGQRLNHRKLIGRVLVRNRYSAVATGTEGKLGFGIERAEVDTLTDRNAGYYFAAGIVHHEH